MSDTEAACQAGLEDLMAYCSRVGIKLQASKIRRPAQRDAPALGLEVDTVRMVARLPDDKRYSIAVLVAVAQHALDSGWLLDKNFWLKLGGKLNYASEVLTAGRAHLPAIWDVAYAKQHADLSRLSPSLGWWLSALADKSRSGERMLVMHGLPGLDLRLYSDATGEHAAGLVMGQFAGWWKWDEATAAAGKGGRLIRYQELYPLLQFARDVVSKGWFAGMRITFCTDSEVNFYALNRERSSDALANDIIKEIRVIFDEADTVLHVIWVPRELNVDADAISNQRTPADARDTVAGILYPGPSA